MLKIQTAFLWTRCNPLKYVRDVTDVAVTVHLRRRLLHVQLFFFFLLSFHFQMWTIFIIIQRTYQQLLHWFVLVKAIPFKEKGTKETALKKSAHLFILKAHKSCYSLVCSTGIGQGHSWDDSGLNLLQDILENVIPEWVKFYCILKEAESHQEVQRYKTQMLDTAIHTLVTFWTVCPTSANPWEIYMHNNLYTVFL